MPTLSEALRIATQHEQAGRLDAAEEICRRVLVIEPECAEAWHLLGLVAYQTDMPEAAFEYFGRAVQLDPAEARFHNNLGAACHALGRIPEAVCAFRRALELKPDDAETYGNLGNACRDQGQFDEAIACYRRALEFKPDLAGAHSNLGNAFRDQGNLHEALACYRRALELKPDLAGTHSNLGNVFRSLGKLDEALACYRRALELKPNLAGTHSNLGNAFRDQGKFDEALACYRRALELKPDFTEAHDNLLGALQYCAAMTPACLAQAHAEFDRRHAAPLRSAILPDACVRDPQRPLRLGFVSPNLACHPVGYFLLPVMENLRREQHDAICYSDAVVPDDMTRRLRAAAAQWRDVRGMSDERLADQIRADRIDILFDLAGHTADNRLLVFARKPAPIQVTWAGYVGTTGLTAIDYLLADRFEVPPGAELHYAEQVLRMPDGYVCYDPPRYAPPVSALPASQSGRLTFGSFNNPLKINPQVVEVWARILRRLPQSRLVLKYRGLSEPANVQRLTQGFARHAVDPQRVACLGPSDHFALLAEYDRIDLALDPFSYNGGLTTCEALWMGVPVVTCPGETFASRHGLSHLSNVGLAETIARDLDDYVEIAVRLADDLPRLAAIRAGLRDQMAASPLCDGPRFARNLMALLRDVWQRWCATAESRPPQGQAEICP